MVVKQEYCLNLNLEKKPMVFDVVFFENIQVFDRKHKPEKVGNLPENFDEVIPNLIYRGSWPNDISPLLKKGITKIITLYSNTDKTEVEDLIKLQQQTNKTKIIHHSFNIINNQSYWLAADEVLKTNQKTYIHCRGGSIRTGIVSLLTEFLYIKNTNKICDKEKLFKLINKTISHGYNYYNDSYRLLFENIIKESYSRKLLPKNIFK